MRLRDPMKRLNIVLLLIFFVLSLFAGRLVQLQGIKSSMYAKEALAKRLHRIDLPAVRGDIVDGNGNKLAMSIEARGVFVDPTRVDPAKRDQMATQLSSMLGLSPASVLRDLTWPKTQFRMLAHNVPPDRARLVTALGYKGIGTVVESTRAYPAKNVGANVIGFVNQSGDGGAGLEYMENKRLKGRSGWQRVEISQDGQTIPMGEGTTLKPIPGQGLKLSLLQDLQWKAEEVINAKVKETKSLSGTAIVMTPSGQILAMASSPGYDPNNYAKATPEQTKDRPVEEAFEPGSTGKIITAAALIEKGLVTPETAFDVPDKIQKYDRTFHDSHPHPLWKGLTFAGIIAKSSNVGTIKASDRMTSNDLYDYLKAFGFGAKTGINLPGETEGLLKSPDRWAGTDRYPIAYGQTISVSALQMASVYATIANGGVRVTPTLIDGTLDEHDKVTPAAPPASRRVISAETAHQLIRILEGVTSDEGTAAAAEIPGYRVAGKTGTAYRINPATGKYPGGGYTASYAGFAPADNPQLVVQVVLQKPLTQQYGGEGAAKAFKDLMLFSLMSRGVPQTGTIAPKLNLWTGKPGTG
jgi:cell division protein FtsI (penicillin-binding protein 3)